MTKIDYKQKKLLSTEEVGREQLELAIQEVKLNLEGDALATQREVIKCERELKEAKQEYPLDIDRIIAKTKSLEGYKKGLEIIQGLQKEFGFVE